MKCEKCGKEIPDGENKICEDCKKSLLNNLQDSGSEQTEKACGCKCLKNKSIIICCLLLVLIILFGLQIKFDVADIVIDKLFENEVGNTVENIRNFGYTAAQGSKIYYVAPVDYTKIGIYKAKKDGSDKEVLIADDWEILSLNVKDDYIYFIALSADMLTSSVSLGSDESLDALNNKIYRMKTDGSELEVINDNEFHNNNYEIYVIGDKVFYIGIDQNIWYMGLDGSNKTRLNDDETGYLGVTDKYIIFNAKKEQENKENKENEETVVDASQFETCVMDLKGTNRKKILGKRLYSINIKGDYIYYLDDDKHVHRVKIDGSDDITVSEETAYNMNVTDDYIFYMNYSSEDKSKISLYRMDLDGKNVTSIYDFESGSSYLNNVNGKVCFMDNGNMESTMNMLDAKGKNRVKLYCYDKQVNPILEDDHTEDEIIVDEPPADISLDGEVTENTEQE